MDVKQQYNKKNNQQLKISYIILRYFSLDIMIVSSKTEEHWNRINDFFYTDIRQTEQTVEYNSGHKIELDDKADSYAWFDTWGKTCVITLCQKNIISRQVWKSAISQVLLEKVSIGQGCPRQKAIQKKGLYVIVTV